MMMEGGREEKLYCVCNICTRNNRCSLCVVWFCVYNWQEVRFHNHKRVSKKFSPKKLFDSQTVKNLKSGKFLIHPLLKPRKMDNFFCFE